VEIAEPVTLLTDVLLAAVAVFLGLRLLRETSSLPARLFASSFFALAAAAFLGGLVHGFSPRFSPSLHAQVWLATYAFAGLANLCLLAGAIVAWTPRVYQRPLLGLAGFRLGVYLFLIASSAREFKYVAYDFSGTLVAVALLALFGRSARPAPVEPALAGVAISLLGAGVQVLGLKAAEHFNHNDAFHVLEILAVHAFYRAARRFDA
jgi:hypothetical protein